MKNFAKPLVVGALCLFPAGFVAADLPGKARTVAAVEIPSLVGTTPDGAVHVDDRGALVVDLELRLFFDYFLSARGEVDDAVLRAAVRSAALERVPASAASRTVDLFDRYLRYLDEARARVPVTGEGEDLAVAYERLVQVRTEQLGPDVADAFFGGEVARELATLELQAALMSPSKAVASQGRLAWEASLGTSEKAARAAAVKPLEVAERVRALRLAGGDEAEVRRLRVEAFGAEAADRLEQLDRERSEWDARVEEFAARRDALLTEVSLSAKARQQALDALAEQLFTEQERRRLRGALLIR